jgi:hypothetical protein
MTANLSLAPATITRRLRAAGVEGVRSTSVRPGVVRVSVDGATSEVTILRARFAAATLLQQGYDVSRSGALITVTLPEPAPAGEPLGAVVEATVRAAGGTVAPRPLTEVVEGGRVTAGDDARREAARHAEVDLDRHDGIYCLCGAGSFASYNGFAKHRAAMRRRAAAYLPAGEFLDAAPAPLVEVLDGEFRHDEHGARYWTAEEVAAERRVEEAAVLGGYGLPAARAQEEARPVHYTREQIEARFREVDTFVLTLGPADRAYDPETGDTFLGGVTIRYARGSFPGSYYVATILDDDPHVDDGPREQPAPVEWSEGARPAHVPASVPDAEVDQYLDAYPFPGA